MAVKLETQTIRIIALFEKITKVHARDCIEMDNCVYFLVDPGKVGLAIGKGGSVINGVRKALGKTVKVFGYYDNPEDMVKNLIPGVKNIELNGGSMVVSIQPKERTAAVGRNGANIRAVKEIMNRHFSIKNLKLR
ncbi:MAG: NusA-like transcription termination signal-binding factor [Candidatus Aenigmarchaeota archaeon]|nr:NusA-like transcription termination signal-binding factor [Candidatus Aenigmarchaeota archaeon]